MPRILLVEDNELNRDMLTRRLERRGFEVLSAEDGAQGVALARSAAPAGAFVPPLPAPTASPALPAPGARTAASPGHA